MSKELNPQAVAEKIADRAFKTTFDKSWTQANLENVILAATVLVNLQTSKLCSTNTSIFQNIKCFSPQQKRLYTFIKKHQNEIANQQSTYKQIFESILTEIWNQCKYQDENMECKSDKPTNVDKDLWEELGLNKAVDKTAFKHDVTRRYTEYLSTLQKRSLEAEKADLVAKFYRDFGSEEELTHLKSLNVFKRLHTKFLDVEQKSDVENFLQDPTFSFDETRTLLYYENLINQSRQYLEEFISKFNQSGFQPTNQTANVVIKIIDLLTQHDKATEADAKAKAEAKAEAEAKAKAEAEAKAEANNSSFFISIYYKNKFN